MRRRFTSFSDACHRSPAMTDTDRARELARAETLVAIEKAMDEVSALCNGRKWRMCIPARPNEDSDLVIADALSKAKAMLAAPPPAARDAREPEWTYRDTEALKRNKSQMAEIRKLRAEASALRDALALVI